MRFIWLKCKECESELDVACDADNAMICPECLSIDCFKQIDEGDEE